MNVLITGGNGFLGYNIVNLLLQQNYNVLVLSRNFNRFTETKNKRLKLVNITTDTYTPYEDVIRDFSPDIVIHCAWSGGNNYKDINHINQYNHNIPAGVSLLEVLCKLDNKPKFIGVGSFAEYGILTTKAEEAQIEQPINHYGLSKNVFKSISKLFCEINNMQWTWIRPCYVYGKGDVDTRLLPLIVSKLKKGEQIVLDSCNTTIDYLHVSDFSKAVLSIILTDQTGIYNICSGQEYSLRDIINYIVSKTETNAQIIFDSTKDRKYASKYICGSNSKLLKDTSWLPEINIYNGIEDIIL